LSRKAYSRPPALGQGPRLVHAIGDLVETDPAAKPLGERPQEGAPCVQRFGVRGGRKSRRSVSRIASARDQDHLESRIPKPIHLRVQLVEPDDAALRLQLFPREKQTREQGLRAARSDLTREQRSRPLAGRSIQVHIESNSGLGRLPGGYFALREQE
jgi:hypothetical protein